MSQGVFYRAAGLLRIFPTVVKVAIHECFAQVEDAHTKIDWFMVND